MCFFRNVAMKRICVRIYPSMHKFMHHFYHHFMHQEQQDKTKNCGTVVVEGLTSSALISKKRMVGFFFHFLIQNSMYNLLKTSNLCVHWPTGTPCLTHNGWCTQAKSLTKIFPWPEDHFQWGSLSLYKFSRKKNMTLIYLYIIITIKNKYYMYIYIYINIHM